MATTVTTTHRVRVTGDLFHGQVPDGAVYVGRPAPGLPGSRYANPHKVGDCRSCGATHDQAGAVAAYASYLDSHPAVLAAARAQLVGRDVACWCRPAQPCHADVLLRLVSGPRVWLAAGSLRRAEPVDHPPVRDDLMRVWVHAAGGRYDTADGRHHATWDQLHARFDLVEVIGQ